MKINKIPVFKPSVDKSVIREISKVIASGWLGMGNLTHQFEKKIAKFLQIDERIVVCTNTGTSALHLALIVAGVKPLDEVIVPAFNFVADHQVITASGAKPVFCDIRDDNLGADCESIRRVISKKTKAILVLHYAGIPCDIENVYKIAKEYDLRVIEDGTHAFGTKYNGKFIGNSGDVTCFSFDPIKIITSIDGGAVVVNTSSEARQLRQFRILGITLDTLERLRNKRLWDYDVVTQGWRYHLNDVNSAIGINQLNKINQFIKNRRCYCRLYNSLLSSLNEITIPATDFTNISPYLYYIRVKNNKRQELMEYLKRHKIESTIHWIPAHKFSFYKNCKKDNLTITEKVAEEILTLPLYSYMEKKTIEYICKNITNFFKKKY